MAAKVVYYQDELTDDFANTNIETKPLRENYRYIQEDPVWKTAAFFLYRVIAQPLVYLIVKVMYHQRFRNKEVLEQAGDAGIYIYANHTGGILDAFMPNLLRRSGRGYIVVGPDTMSIPGLNNIVQMLGAIPLGDTMKQKKEMFQCVRTRVEQKNIVTIYPEAHIWPYYTGIRPFTAASFGYPSGNTTPVYAMTNCYQKRMIGRRPKVVTYLDGPFYPDESLPAAKRREKLRDQCYQAMKARTDAYSTYSYVVYEKQSDLAE